MRGGKSCIRVAGTLHLYSLPSLGIDTKPWYLFKPKRRCWCLLKQTLTIVTNNILKRPHVTVTFQQIPHDPLTTPNTITNLLTHTMFITATSPFIVPHHTTQVIVLRYSLHRHHTKVHSTTPDYITTSYSSPHQAFLSHNDKPHHSLISLTTAQPYHAVDPHHTPSITTTAATLGQRKDKVPR